MTMVKVEGYSSYVKDTSSGGIINLDKSSYEARLRSKALVKREEEQKKQTQYAIANLQSEINTIKSDVSDIREMLLQLIQKGNP